LHNEADRFVHFHPSTDMRQRQRHRETERQRDRETERQRDRDTETQRQRDTETQRHRDEFKSIFKFRSIFDKFKNRFEFVFCFGCFGLQSIFSNNGHTLFWYNYIHVLSVYSKQMSKSLLYIKVFSSQFESL